MDWLFDVYVVFVSYVGSMTGWKWVDNYLFNLAFNWSVIDRMEFEYRQNKDSGMYDIEIID